MPLEQELVLFLECQDVSVNLRLFSDAVARPEALRSATSSGAYRRGCCMLRLTDLEPKTYVLVVSTFRPGVSWPMSKNLVEGKLPWALETSDWLDLAERFCAASHPNMIRHTCLDLNNS